MTPRRNLCAYTGNASRKTRGALCLKCTSSGQRCIVSLTLVFTIFLIFIFKVIALRKRFPQPLLEDEWHDEAGNLTVVSAFLDLGEFPKGTLTSKRSPETYKQWINIYKFMKNPLVIFTDSKEFADFFQNLRENSSATTRIVQINRESLWSYKIKPNISKIFAKPGYPKHYPNTYIPDYTCMTHSKLTLVVEAIKSNLFSTKYYCWLDLGYFRDLVQRRRYFQLDVPHDFDDNKIGVTEVYKVNLRTETARPIILQNKNWIGGGLFLGKPDVFVDFELQYKQRVLYFLSQGLMNVEQHILFSMYTSSERENNPITVEVQTYIPGTKKVICADPWFYLGCLMYREIQD